MGYKGPIEDFVVITGFSGAGKSQAMATFEDAGYFCVDNLPPGMIRSLAELFGHEGSKVERAAVASDVRGGVYFDGLVRVLDDLDGRGVPYRLLYLEAAPSVLINRFKETRRRHPLADGGSVEAAIRQEQALLTPLKERADVSIDTTDLGVARDFYGGRVGLQVLIESDDFLTFKCGGDSRLVVTRSSTGTSEPVVGARGPVAAATRRNRPSSTTRTRSASASSRSPSSQCGRGVKANVAGSPSTSGSARRRTCGRWGPSCTRC